MRDLNGWILGADDADCISVMESLAAGDLSEKAFAAWLREHIENE
jgi:death on curing protein